MSEVGRLIEKRRGDDRHQHHWPGYITALPGNSAPSINICEERYLSVLTIFLLETSLDSDTRALGWGICLEQLVTMSTKLYKKSPNEIEKYKRTPDMYVEHITGLTVSAANRRSFFPAQALA